MISVLALVCFPFLIRTYRSDLVEARSLADQIENRITPTGGAKKKKLIRNAISQSHNYLQ
jgi:hypothetical protein